MFRCYECLRLTLTFFQTSKEKLPLQDIIYCSICLKQNITYSWKLVRGICHSFLLFYPWPCSCSTIYPQLLQRSSLSDPNIRPFPQPSGLESFQEFFSGLDHLLFFVTLHLEFPSRDGSREIYIHPYSESSWGFIVSLKKLRFPGIMKLGNGRGNSRSSEEKRETDARKIPFSTVTQTQACLLGPVSLSKQDLENGQESQQRVLRSTIF